MVQLIISVNRWIKTFDKVVSSPGVVFPDPICTKLFGASPFVCSGGNFSESKIDENPSDPIVTRPKLLMRNEPRTWWFSSWNNKTKKLKNFDWAHLCALAQKWAQSKYCYLFYRTISRQLIANFIRFLNISECNGVCNCNSWIDNFMIK